MTSLALCCSIPVFRYALEHWIPEPFIVHVISKSGLNDEQLALLKELKESSQIANVRVVIHDGKNEELIQDKEWIQNYSSQESKAAGTATAWLALEAAKTSEGAPRVVWDAPFTKEALTQMLHSPIRSAVSEKLVSKDSVVWVFLESGKQTLDDSKFAKLESELKRLESSIKLPVIEEADLKDLSKRPDELQLRFSALRLSRTDSKESALISMLLATESDLRQEFEAGVPMAFPIFGRGRVLYALLGDGIATGTIEEASRFLAGACQCTVKADNPGVDLLFSYPWSDQVHITEPKKEDVPLTGLGSYAGPPKTSTDSPSGTTVSKNEVAIRESPYPDPLPTAMDSKPIEIAVDVPTTTPSFALLTLGALTAIVGAITLGWMFMSGSKY